MRTEPYAPLLGLFAEEHSIRAQRNRKTEKETEPTLDSKVTTRDERERRTRKRASESEMQGKKGKIPMTISK
jgi:hypothetical protein